MRPKLINRIVSIGSTAFANVICSYHTDHVFGVANRTAVQHIGDGVVASGM